MPSLFLTFLKNLVERGMEYFKRYYGAYRATCMDVKDPNKQGRIKVRVPIVTGKGTHQTWAWPMMPMGGKAKGSFWVPDEGDPVYVMFENGDARYPMYFSGYWPNPGDNNFAPEDAYESDGETPSKRIFRTKAGHELSFEDNAENLSVKMIWKDGTDPDNEKFSFFAITPDGSIQMANHKGCMVDMRAKDGEELIMVVDATGNSLTMDKDGIKAIDATGNIIEMKKDTVQVIGTKNFILNCPSVNVKTGGMAIGDVAVESTLKGTSWLAWWTSTVLIWLNTHTHPTGVGPSGPPLSPAQPPQKEQLLTDILKVQ